VENPCFLEHLPTKVETGFVVSKCDHKNNYSKTHVLLRVAYVFTMSNSRKLAGSGHLQDHYNRWGNGGRV
jgi:hypothetical protein